MFPPRTTRRPLLPSWRCDPDVGGALHASIATATIWNNGVFAEVVKQSDGYAIRIERVMMYEHVRPKLILIIGPYPDPLVGPNVDADGRRIKCP